MLHDVYAVLNCWVWCKDDDSNTCDSNSKKTPLWGLFCNVVSDVDDEDDYEYHEKVICHDRVDDDEKKDVKVQ